MTSSSVRLNADTTDGRAKSHRYPAAEAFQKRIGPRPARPREDDPGGSGGTACPSCSAIADGFNGFVVHLANHDVMVWAVSRAPLAKLQAYKRRMGWSFPWASSFGSDFNYDFQAAYTQEQQQSGVVEYNFRTWDLRPSREAGQQGPIAEIAADLGTDVATYTREAPDMSAFALNDGVVYHTYSTCARGVGRPLGHVPVARPRAPLGRNETSICWCRHDEYRTQ